jgi:hypothetical protein
MRRSISLTTSALLLVVLPAALHSQQRSVELGTDALFFHQRLTFDDGSHASSTQLQLPTGLRAGFFLSPRASIEVKLALRYIDPSDGDSYTSLTFAAGPMIHFSPDISRAQPYVRPCHSQSCDTCRSR